MVTGMKVGIAAGIAAVGVGIGIAVLRHGSDGAPAAPKDAWDGKATYDSGWDSFQADYSGNLTMSGTRDTGAGAWSIAMSGAKIAGSSTAGGFRAQSTYYSTMNGSQIGDQPTLVATRSAAGDVQGSVTVPVTIGAVGADGTLGTRTVESTRATFTAHVSASDAWRGVVDLPTGTDVTIAGSRTGDDWKIDVGHELNDGTNHVSTYEGHGPLSVNQAITMAVELAN